MASLLSQVMAVLSALTGMRMLELDSVLLMSSLDVMSNKASEEDERRLSEEGDLPAATTLSRETEGRARLGVAKRA